VSTALSPVPSVSADREGRTRTEERQGQMEGGMGGEGAAAVYAGVTREGRQVKSSGVRETGVGGVADVLCAAVVAASPDSFEINRN
jgi:hypothetical protein